MIPLIIHSAKRLDRYDNFTAELSSQGLDKDCYYIVDAVIRDIPEVGCTLAHKKCIQIAIDSKWDYVIIMEDDICFQPGGWQHFIDGFKKLPDDWDLYFGGVYHGVVTDLGGGIAKVDDCCSTHLYAVHSRYYSQVMSCPEIKGQHIDRWYANSQCAYLAWPMAAIQKPSYSDIVKNDVDYTHYLKERNLKLLGE